MGLITLPQARRKLSSLDSQLGSGTAISDLAEQAFDFQPEAPYPARLRRCQRRLNYPYRFVTSVNHQQQIPLLVVIRGHWHFAGSHINTTTAGRAIFIRTIHRMFVHYFSITTSVVAAYPSADPACQQCLTASDGCGGIRPPGSGSSCVGSASTSRTFPVRTNAR